MLALFSHWRTSREEPGIIPDRQVLYIAQPRSAIAGGCRCDRCPPTPLERKSGLGFHAVTCVFVFNGIVKIDRLDPYLEQSQ